jgi:hypothetical protein
MLSGGEDKGFQNIAKQIGLNEHLHKFILFELHQQHWIRRFHHFS